VKRIGIAVGAREVRVALTDRHRVRWMACAAYTGYDDLAEVIARLASEAPQRPREASVVLSAELVQMRCLNPAPPLRPAAARAHVALNAARFFRNGHGPLVTDARIIRVPGRRAVLCAAAALEALVGAVASGCEQAGLEIDGLGPATEILPAAVNPNDRSPIMVVSTVTGTTEMEVAEHRAFRARRSHSVSALRWATPLASLGDDAVRFAEAFAAASITTRIDLRPASARDRTRRTLGSKAGRIAVAAMLVWGAAYAMRQLRYEHVGRQAEAKISHFEPARPALDSLRRDLALASSAIMMIRMAEAQRSRQLVLLAALTRAMSDSTVLTSIRIDGDSLLHLSGYTRSADRAVAELERVALLQRPRLEGPASREVLPGHGEFDRFAAAARVKP
jgi:hypothetical protein